MAIVHTFFVVLLLPCGILIVYRNIDTGNGESLYFTSIYIMFSLDFFICVVLSVLLLEKKSDTRLLYDKKSKKIDCVTEKFIKKKTELVNASRISTAKETQLKMNLRIKNKKERACE